MVDIYRTAKRRGKYPSLSSTLRRISGRNFKISRAGCLEVSSLNTLQSRIVGAKSVGTKVNIT